MRATRGLAARPAGRRTSSARRTWSSRPRVGRRAAERTPMAAPRPPSRPPQATPQAPPEASSATGRVPTRPTEARRRSPQVPAAPRIHPLRDAASSHSPRPATSRARPASRRRSGGSSGPPSAAPRPPARVGSRAIRRGPPGRAPGSARPRVPDTTRPQVPRPRPRSRGSPAGERHRSASRARPGRAAATSASTVASDARAAPIGHPLRTSLAGPHRSSKNADGEDDVDEGQQCPLEPVRLAVERDERADPHRGADRRDLERLRTRGPSAGRSTSPSSTSTGATNSATWRLTSRSARPSRTPSCSSGELDGDEVLGEVADRRDEDHADEELGQAELSMNGSIDPDEDLRQHRQQRRRASSTTTAIRPVHAGPPWPSAGSPGRRASRRVRELEHERQHVARPSAAARRAPIPRPALSVRRIRGREREHGRDEQPDRGEHEQRGVRAGDLPAEPLDAVPQPAEQQRWRRGRAAGCR